MDFEITKKEKRKQYLKLASRIALIIFIGISIYLFISAIILIILTKPDKEVEVPYVTGKRFVEVYNSLIRKGLIPEIKLNDVYDMDNGIILNQHPEKGTIVAEGDKIKLVVSRNKVNITVPNLIGIKLPFAIKKISKIHLNEKSYSIGVGIISYIPSDTIADSVIIDHNPGAGEEISPDRKINLLVSAGNAENDKKIPDVTGQSIDLCFDLLLSKGLNIDEDIILTDTLSESGKIESQIPVSGADIQPGSTIKIKVLYYPQREKPYSSYERIIYNVSMSKKAGLYEAYIEDDKSKRIRFSKNLKPGGEIDFLFKRKGDARIIITNNKKVIDDISIEADTYN